MRDEEWRGRIDAVFSAKKVLKWTRANLKLKKGLQNPNQVALRYHHRHAITSIVTVTSALLPSSSQTHSRFCRPLLSIVASAQLSPTSPTAVGRHLCSSAIVYPAVIPQPSPAVVCPVVVSPDVPNRPPPSSAQPSPAAVDSSDQGLTVVNTSAAAFPQALDWLHNYLLQRIEEGISFVPSGNSGHAASDYITLDCTHL
nr:P-loop containing nucleoside triphosphate hydrolases superfamily protein [Ipomoea batatas]